LTPAKEKGGDASTSDGIQRVGDISLVVRHLTDVPAKDLKPLVDDLKAQITSGVVVVTSCMEGKVSLVIGVTQDLTSRISAVDLVRSAAPVLGGSGGGGRPDLAQAGGTQTDVKAAIEAIEKVLQSL